VIIRFLGRSHAPRDFVLCYALALPLFRPSKVGFKLHFLSLRFVLEFTFSVRYSDPSGPFCVLQILLLDVSCHMRFLVLPSSIPGHHEDSHLLCVVRLLRDPYRLLVHYLVYAFHNVLSLLRSCSFVWGAREHYLFFCSLEATLRFFRQAMQLLPVLLIGYHQES